MTEPLSAILPGFPSQSVPYAETLYNVLKSASLQQFKERSYES
jgi:hypothetical protein